MQSAMVALPNLGKDGKPQAAIAKISLESMPGRDDRHDALARSLFLNKFRKLRFVAYNRDALSVHSSLLNVLLHD